MSNLQTIELVEIESEEDRGLCYQVDIVVLVKNKLMFNSGHDSELHLDCVTSDITFNPMILDLYFSFKPDSHELIEANKEFQVGEFFRVKGEVNLCIDMEDEEVDSMTMYEPDCKHISSDTLPPKFTELLVRFIDKNDLCYDYMGADHMQIQYKKVDIFPWLNHKI